MMHIIKNNRCYFVMPFQRSANRNIILSLFLMMVCVQTFSVHSHIAYEQTDPHSHILAHSHASESLTEHHSGLTHESSDDLTLDCALCKHLATFLFLIFALVLLLYPAAARSQGWSFVFSRLGSSSTLYFRPPLRAPPLIIA